MNGAFATDRVQSDSNSLLDGVLSQQTSDTVASNHIFMQPLLHASLTSVPIALVVYPASTTSTWYQHAAVVAATRPYPAFAMHATTAYAVAVNQAAVAAAPVLQTGGSPLLLRPAHLVITAADQHSSHAPHTPTHSFSSAPVSRPTCGNSSCRHQRSRRPHATQPAPTSNHHTAAQTHWPMSQHADAMTARSTAHHNAGYHLSATSAASSHNLRHTNAAPVTANQQHQHHTGFGAHMASAHPTMLHAHLHSLPPDSATAEPLGAVVRHGHYHRDSQQHINTSNMESLPPLATQINDNSSRGLSRIELESIPTLHFSDVDRDPGAEQTSCVVCMCDFEPRQKLRSLPCAHEFHIKCVDRWLKHNRTCPICRSDALSSNQQ